MRAGVVQDLVERDAGEVRELHLDDWPHPFECGADGSSNHRVLADRRIQNAPGEFFRQALGRLERAAELSSDILTVDKHALVLLEKMGLRLANGLEISDAHRFAIRE